VKAGDLLRSCLFGVVYFELRSEGVGVDKAMYHFHAFGFHRVFLTQLIFGDVLVIEIANLSHLLL
jgi:hypothetical protein